MTLRLVEAPIEGSDGIRQELLISLRQFVGDNAVATLAATPMRPMVISHALEELTYCFMVGNVAKDRDAARRVASDCRLFVGPQMRDAGLGAALDGMIRSAYRQALRRLGSSTVAADLRDAAGVSKEVSSAIDAISSGAESENYVRTGIGELDRKLGGGLPRGEMTLCGAPTGMGKTTFAMQIAWEAACEDRGLVLVVSPEMRATDLWLRLAHRETGYTRDDLRPSSPSHDTALEAITKAVSRQSERANLTLLDRVDADLTMALEGARMLHETRGPLYLVVLDYAQQLASQTSEGKRYLEIGRVATSALELAAATGAAVLVTSQVNSLRGKGGDVVDYTFRESQVMEHKASIVFVMVARYEEKRLVFQVRKNRHGGLGSAECEWTPSLFKMADVGIEAVGPEGW
jgi:replicative DNA helicase